MGVKNESEKIVAKQKEEEKRKIMEAGLSVAQGKVDVAVAEREAVEAVNVERVHAKSALGAEIEAMGSVAQNDIAEIKEGEAACDTATKKLNALKQKSSSEIASLKTELANTITELTTIKEQTAKELSDVKAKHAVIVDDCHKTRASAVNREAKEEGKLEIQKMEDEITKLVRLGTALRREKKEQMGAIGSSDQMKWIHGRLVQLLEA